ncbi:MULTISPECIES: hemerythrin domain-containing protein [unclassified Knoellia]|uniref:hemerythrin domain-containing protein n=1 Tax=Knoellia altitudinis TaxID=3404795 RepID=UPI00360A26E8
MNMNVIIHTAVRRDLTRFESALRSFPDGSGARAQQLRRAWATLDRQLHHHHESEDAYVWPYLRGLGVADPALLDSMESEHRAMADGLGAVADALDALVADPSRARAIAAADTVAETARVTNTHLVHEEQDVMPIIIEREHTPEWKTVEKQLRKGGPVMAGELFAWLEDGGDPVALASLRATVPAPVRLVLSRFVGRAYHREVAPVWRV